MSLADDLSEEHLAHVLNSPAAKPAKPPTLPWIEHKPLARFNVITCLSCGSQQKTLLGLYTISTQGETRIERLFPSSKPLPEGLTYDSSTIYSNPTFCLHCLPQVPQVPKGTP
jgi:hypothetical protein